jgi:DNA-binding response OmpR family regulator
MKKVVLVIDDDESILEASTILLMMEGYDVVPRSHANHIEKMLVEHHPDVVLLDVLLQGKSDGRRVCKEIKRLSKTPVILFSASTNLSTMAAECGADDYLPKPFDISQLTSIIGKWAR